MNKFKLIFFATKHNRYSIAYILAALERSNLNEYFDVEVIKESEFEQHILPSIKDYKQIIICFSFMTNYCIDIYNYLCQFKQMYLDHDTIYIAGGPHPTGDYRLTLKMGFDYIVVGEGERVFIELLSSIVNNSDIHLINGVASYRNNELSYKKNDNLIDIDNSFPITHKYFKTAPIEITRGCNVGCTYCQTPTLFSPKVRFRSIDSIIWCVKDMASIFIKDMRFISSNSLGYSSEDGITPNITVLKELFFKLSEVSLKKHIFFGTFPCEVRPEFVNEDTISLLINYTNCKYIIVGAQSGSNRLLDKLHRKHSIEQVFQAVSLLRKYNIDVIVDYLYCTPDENDEDIELSISSIKKLVEMGAVIHSHYFIPLPGTKYYNSDPKPLTPNLVKVLETLSGTGAQFGQWKMQWERVVAFNNWRKQFD